MSNIEPVKPTQPPKEKVRHRDWWGALFFLLIGTVGLLLGRLGHLWIRLDVFSQFGMQALLLTVASLLALVVPKYKGLSAAVFAALLLAGYSLWPHVISSHGIVAANASPGAKILRVATFNSYILNNQIDDVEKTIRAMAPDVMTIIEFGGNKAP